MGTGQSKISARIQNVWGDVWGRKLKMYLLLTPDIGGFQKCKVSYQSAQAWIDPTTEVLCGARKKNTAYCEKWLFFTPFLHSFSLSALCVTLSCCDASGEHHRHSVEYLSFLLHRTCLPSGERARTTHSAFSMLAIQNQGDSEWLRWFFPGHAEEAFACAHHCCLHQQEPSRAAVRMLPFLFLIWNTFHFKCSRCCYYLLTQKETQTRIISSLGYVWNTPCHQM